MHITETLLRQIIRETIASQYSGPAIEIVKSGNWIKFRTSTGEIDTRIADGALTVREASVKEESRGQGIGVALYSAALDYAQENGLRFQSSNMVSISADRVWQSLQHRGAPLHRAAEVELDTSFPGGGKWHPIKKWRGISVRTEEPLWTTV